MKQPRIAIVTPVFNEKATTLRFLDSVDKITYSDYEVIIVDMGSDGTREAIKKLHPTVIVIKEGDVFWAGGTNAGVKYALANGFDYVFTVNDDVELKPDILDSLAKKTIVHPQALIGSKVCYIDDRKRVWFAGGILDHRRGAFAHGEYSESQLKEFRPVEWLTGMGALIPVEVFEKVGFYDTDYFPQYYADADLSLRAAEAGFDLFIDPDAIVYGDIDSSWYAKKMYKPRLRLLWDTYFSMRSNYNIRIQTEFHKRHWKGNYRLALINLYARTIPRLTIQFVKAYAKYPLRKLLGRVK